MHTEPNDPAPLIAAIKALDATMTGDPDHVPDQIGPDHYPDLVGILAALTDRAMLPVEPSDDARRRWGGGYLGVTAPDGDFATHTGLGQLAVRLGLDATIAGHWAADGNPYARLTTDVLNIACHLAVTASRTEDPTDHFNRHEARALHKNLKTALRHLRGAIESLDRTIGNDQ